MIIKKKFLSLLKNSLIRKSGIYTLSSIFEKAIPFLLLPILTRYLSTEDYGIVSMFTVMVGLTTAFTGLGIKPAVLRSYYKDDVNFSVYLTNALLILLISTSVVGSLFFIFSDIITKYTDFPSDWLITVVAASAGQFIINLILVVWQAKAQPIPYGAFNFSVTSLNMSLSIFLIVGMGFGWEGRVIGTVSAIVIFSIIGLGILWYNHMIKFIFVWDYIKHALGYGLPLIPHIISGTLLTYLDRIFITNMVGISETGIYTVGYKIGMIIMVIASSFNKAWSPWLFEKLNKGNKGIKKKIVKFTYLYFIVIILLANVLAFTAPLFLRYFIGENFYTADKYIAWIAWGYAFNGMYYMVSGYIFYEEKTKYLAWVTLVSAIVNIALNYILISIFGAIGAAIATTITFFVMFILTWFISSRIYSMPWKL